MLSPVGPDGNLVNKNHWIVLHNTNRGRRYNTTWGKLSKHSQKNRNGRRNKIFTLVSEKLSILILWQNQRHFWKNKTLVIQLLIFTSGQIEDKIKDTCGKIKDVCGKIKYNCEKKSCGKI